jgi:hypothetical protein
VVAPLVERRAKCGYQPTERQYRERQGRGIQEQQRSLRRKVRQLLGVKERSQVEEFMALLDEIKGADRA